MVEWTLYDMMTFEKQQRQKIGLANSIVSKYLIPWYYNLGLPYWVDRNASP